MIEMDVHTDLLLTYHPESIERTCGSAASAHVQTMQTRADILS
jgi:hypothetical protein